MVVAHCAPYLSCLAEGGGADGGGCSIQAVSVVQAREAQLVSLVRNILILLLREGSGLRVTTWFSFFERKEINVELNSE